MGKLASKEALLVVSKTISSDNGKGIANHQIISRKFGIEYYFKRPYHDCELGANENLNSLIIQFFPKKMNFENITQEQINTVINNLNNRLRKRFGYKTPNEILAKKIHKFEPVAFII